MLLRHLLEGTVHTMDRILFIIKRTTDDITMPWIHMAEPITNELTRVTLKKIIDEGDTGKLPYSSDIQWVIKSIRHSLKFISKTYEKSLFLKISPALVYYAKCNNFCIVLKLIDYAFREK